MPNFPNLGARVFDERGYAIQRLNLGSALGLERGYYKVWFRNPGPLFPAEPEVLDRAMTKRRAKQIIRQHRTRGKL